MRKNKFLHRLTNLNILIVAAILAVTVFGVPLVRASNLQQQIDSLNQQNSQTRGQVGQLQVVASGLADRINQLQQEINVLQTQIDDNNAKIADTEKKISDAEAELAKQRNLLGQNIKAMYLEGEISTIEMLASSKDLSEFVDKQQYRDSVKSKIKDTLDKVNALKNQLRTDKTNLENQKKEQEDQQALLASQRSEQSQLLNANTAEQTALDQQIKSNSARINELRRQQAIENARLFGSTPGTGANCGGGYPGSTSGRWGSWGCNYPLDYSIDNWGMYNRQCVSYTAFKVAASGRNMPYWGGRGNANQWDDNARAAGIAVDQNPRVGDVAVSNAGTYGHTMYVEAVSGDGSIYISDYNQQWDGKYREYWISNSLWRARNLVFIHFP